MNEEVLNDLPGVQKSPLVRGGAVESTERFLHRERDRPKKHLSIVGWNYLVDLMSLLGAVPFEEQSYLRELHQKVPSTVLRVQKLSDATQIDWVHLTWAWEAQRPDLVQKLNEQRRATNTPQLTVVSS